MGSLRRVMDTGRGRQRTLSYPQAAPRGGLDEVLVNNSSPPKRHRRPMGSLRARSIHVPGHSRQRTKLLPCFLEPGGLKAAPPRARRSPPGVASLSSGAPSASEPRRQEPSGGRGRRGTASSKAHLVRRLVARLTGPERRQPQHTARLAHVRLTGRRRPLPVEQPAMPSAPKWTRRDRHPRLRHGSARCRILAVQARLVEPAARPTAGPPRWPAGP